MKRFLIFAILTLTFTCSMASAGEALREINLEWEPIENAKSYEVEITALNTNKDANDQAAPKAMNFKVNEASWSGKLQPGQYSMKLRSKDHRGVPGEWSNQSSFVVNLEAIKIKSPKQNASFNSNSKDNQEVLFEWSRPAGAEEFEVVLKDAQQKSVNSFKTKENIWKTELPVAKGYHFKVKARDYAGNETEEASFVDFTITGAKLETPKIERPESAYVRELRWNQIDHAQNYTYVILRQDPKSKSFQKLNTIKEFKDNKISFDPKWPGGTYRISVKAYGNMRPASDVGSLTFDVVSGNRSPAAEYQALVKKSIDRTSGWYGIASYLITQITYSSVYQETGTSVGYNAIGGTGRLGAGYFSDTSKWGFLGIVDLSGFTYQGSNKTFASIEGAAVYRSEVGTRGELRYSVGAYYKEVPATVGDIVSGTTSNKNLAIIGPQAGIEYWHSMSPKFGLQANAHFYYGMMKASTPNDQDLEPSLSTQFGVLGSYRVTPQLTGLVGYAYRKDDVKYKAGAATFGNGTTNQATVVGNYLNFFAEYDF